MAGGAPQINEATRRETNLAVLRRLDPDVAEVLGQAGHVTIYLLDQTAMAWERKNVEGSLFIVKRRSDPRFQLVVLNRISTENLVEDVLGDFAYELSQPYIMYRNEDVVHGIWFFDEHECERISALLTRILATYQPEPITPAEALGRIGGQPQPVQAAAAPPPVPMYAQDPPPPAPSQPPPPSRRDGSSSGGTDMISRLFGGVKVSQSAEAKPAQVPNPTVSKLLTPADLNGNPSTRAPHPPPPPPNPPPNPPLPLAPHSAGAAAGLSKEQIRSVIARLASNEAFVELITSEVNAVLRS